MALQGWILPILIGIIAAVLLVSILFNGKQRFADLGALIQLQTSRPYFYGLNWMPINYTTSEQPSAIQGQISGAQSPLWINSLDGIINYPVYNYYPKAPINSTKPLAPASTLLSSKSTSSSNNDFAFPNPPQVYDSHKAYYWALSGAYPLSVVAMPTTDMDRIHGIEDKI